MLLSKRYNVQEVSAFFTKRGVYFAQIDVDLIKRHDDQYDWELLFMAAEYDLFTRLFR